MTLETFVLESEMNKMQNIQSLDYPNKMYKLKSFFVFVNV